MTERFKFRVWSTYENEGYLTGGELESVLEINRELDGTDHFFVSHRGAIETDYVFEQCSGLKDKNGKLVYEGDIVRWKTTLNKTSQRMHIDCVTWEAQVACFMLMPFCHEPYGAEMEVIGNIHENPGRLEQP